MFEVIGALLIPIVLYIASRQFERRFFIELLTFLSFAFLILGTTPVLFPQLPDWFSILQFGIVLIIYPIYRFLRFRKRIERGLL